MTTVGGRLLSAAAGLALDLVAGEPPARLHPVARFGAAMELLERRLWRDDKRRGVVHAVAGTTVGAITGRFVPGALAACLAIGGRALDRAAGDVDAALAAGDLEDARRLLPALVGRRPGTLDHDEVARAVVESLAENTVDAVVAPMWWTAVLGGSGALGYRAVNTLDAMVGHRNPRYQRFGWASARLDDAANWVPARLTAGLVVAVRPWRAAPVWRAVRGQAPAHPSPNSGVAEAAFAAALGLVLGGPSDYGDRVEQRPQLGSGRPCRPADLAAARRLAGHVQAASGVLAVLAAVAAHTWGRRR